MAQFRFTPNDRPLFLSGDAKPEHRRFGKAWISVISSLVTAAVIIFAVLLVGNPLVLFANTTASRVSTSAPQDGSGQLMPTIQSSANAQALPPSAKEAPAGDEIFAAFKAAFENKTEVVQPTAAVMFNQFQAWAAKEDAQAPVQPPEPVQNPRAQVVEKAQAQPLPKPRPVQAQHIAPAPDPSEQNAQWPVRIFGWRN
jgi:outer membrane biosynthesis protein TonB